MGSINPVAPREIHSGTPEVEKASAFRKERVPAPWGPWVEVSISERAGLLDAEADKSAPVKDQKVEAPAPLQSGPSSSAEVVAATSGAPATKRSDTYKPLAPRKPVKLPDFKVAKLPELKAEPLPDLPVVELPKAKPVEHSAATEKPAPVSRTA